MLGILGGGPRRAAPIELLGRHQFGRSSSIAIVRAGGKALVVGVTEHSITLLTEADPSALPEEVVATPEATWTASVGGTRPGPTWKAFFERLRERTVRR
jgi:flagellar biogenesis protein FliO